MRNVCAKVLTVSLILLAASPAFAQRQGRGQGGPGGRGGFEMTPSALLRMEKVQEELKLTDDQKAQFTKISDKYKDELATARTDMNREKMAELRKAETEDFDKAIPTVLKPDQAKRLKQLELQAGMQFGGLRVLTKEDVQTALKLTDDQKKSIKDSSEELAKDMQEMFQSAGGDRTKMAEMFTKMQGMQKEATEKVVNSFTDDQKKEWKELTGEKFEFPARTGGRRPGAGAPPPAAPAK
jgi:Spy/CpxP family protein refolding chaperone